MVRSVLVWSIPFLWDRSKEIKCNLGPVRRKHAQLLKFRTIKYNIEVKLTKSTPLINAQNWSFEDNIEMFYFSSFDESWKVGVEGDVGAYWGLWDKDENLKF